VKTTLELPDDLMRAVKIRAATENRRLKDVVTDAIRRGLAQPSMGEANARVQLPLVQCAHDARPEDEMTADRVAEILLREDVEQASRS